jgi:hypothetical protein
METAGSSETLVALYKAAQYHNPKYITLNIHRLQNLKYHIKGKKKVKLSLCLTT